MSELKIGNKPSLTTPMQRSETQTIQSSKVDSPHKQTVSPETSRSGDIPPEQEQMWRDSCVYETHQTTEANPSTTSRQGLQRQLDDRITSASSSLTQSEPRTTGREQPSPTPQIKKRGETKSIDQIQATSPQSPEGMEISSRHILYTSADPGGREMVINGRVTETAIPARQTLDGQTLKKQTISQIDRTFASGDTFSHYSIAFPAGDGLNITLNQMPFENGNRTVLIFRNHNAPYGDEPSRAFSFPYNPDARMYFDEQENVVIQLNQNERIVLDGQTGEHREGPLNLRFDPNDLHRVRVDYTGTQRCRTKDSVGDTSSWDHQSNNYLLERFGYDTTSHGNTHFSILQRQYPGDTETTHSIYTIHIGRHIGEEGEEEITLHNQGLSITLCPSLQDPPQTIIAFENTNHSCDASDTATRFRTFSLPYSPDARMYFDEQENVVIQLNQNERIVLDGRTGDIMQGPLTSLFDLNNFDQVNVSYTGTLPHRQNNFTGLYSIFGFPEQFLQQVNRRTEFEVFE